MCGIWASIGLAAGKERIDRVAHRGPDGEGWRVLQSMRGPVALGHRRLSIIDTSDGGQQPMTDASERYWLVFNGEIYNYRELRDELAAAGVVFRTKSDSEVLLAALIKWGEAALPRLLGMFAFALWDSEAQSLLVARDRFGIKPLYFVANDCGIAFASEIKQLHDLPGVARRMHLGRVRDFLATGILDHSADTMFEGVGQVRGGQLARIDCRHGLPRDGIACRHWYRLPRPGSVTMTLDAAADSFRWLFEDAISLHLRSDVPLGACLSGGLDSSSIVAVASRLLGPGRPMTTISAVFDTARVDERRYMDAVIAANATAARFVTVDPATLFAQARQHVWQQDEPYGSTSIHAQLQVFEGARAAGLKVMLDGQGADEPLAGYHAMFGPALADHVRGLRVGRAVSMLRERRAIHGVTMQQQIARALPNLMPAQARAWGHAYLRRAGGTDWLDGDALRPLASQPTPLQQAADDLGVTSVLDVGSFTALQTMATSLPMLLHWEDRSSMAHGIEARVPFLDHRLVELAIGLGSAHKIEGAVTKVLLRRALGAELPPLVRDRQDKLGFATPEAEWFRGPLAAGVRAGIRNTLDLYPELLDRRATLAFTDEMLTGRRAFDFSLWRIACIGIWGERFELAV